MSSAYRKPDTCWQHDAALNGGMTSGKRARTPPRRIRIRRTRVAGLLAVVAAIVAALGYQLPCVLVLVLDGRLTHRRPSR